MFLIYSMLLKLSFLLWLQSKGRIFPRYKFKNIVCHNVKPTITHVRTNLTFTHQPKYTRLINHSADEGLITEIQLIYREPRMKFRSTFSTFWGGRKRILSYTVPQDSNIYSCFQYSNLITSTFDRIFVYTKTIDRNRRTMLNFKSKMCYRLLFEIFIQFEDISTPSTKIPRYLSAFEKRKKETIKRADQNSRYFYHS